MCKTNYVNVTIRIILSSKIFLMRRQITKPKFPIDWMSVFMLIISKQYYIFNCDFSRSFGFLIFTYHQNLNEICKDDFVKCFLWFGVDFGSSCNLTVEEMMPNWIFYNSKSLHLSKFDQNCPASLWEKHILYVLPYTNYCFIEKKQ